MTSIPETQATDTHHQIIPGMSEHLYPTLVADASLSTPTADNCSTLQNQITSEIDKYLQEAADRRERDDNYFNGQHVATNTTSPQQEDNLLEQDEEDDELRVPESNGQDTGTYGTIPTEHNAQYQDKLETIPEEGEEEDPQMAENQEVHDPYTVAYTSDDSEEEPFNTAIDDTSEDPTIVMGKPVTTAFISDDVRVPTKKVGCLQVTSQLNHFPPESKEKAFEQIYQILQMLDAYLIHNPQQHQYCMSPDSEYIPLIMFATKLKIDLCNFPAIWAVLSILLDTQSNKLQYVKTLQQVVDDYYEKHPMEVMSRLEHQITDIMNAMYDSMTNDNFDSISDDIDRVSGAVDNDYDDNDQMPYDNDNDNDQLPYDNDNDQMPYDNDNEQMPYEYDNENDTATREMKYDGNMTNELKGIGTKDKVPYRRDDNVMTKVKWSIETNDVDNDFMREYDNMCKSMEDRQIIDFNEARRHIQSTMMGDTPVKTGQNRQCIDNVSDYDREHHRIFKSVHHRLDLGPNMLPRSTTVHHC